MLTSKKHVIFVVTLLTLSGCKFPWSSSTPNTKEATENATTTVIKTITSTQAFKNLLATKKPIVAKFTAPWCGACKTIQPTYEKVAQELSQAYTFVAVDIDKAKELSQEFNIKGIPTFIFFKEGKEVDSSKRIIGSSISKDEFLATIKTTLQ